MTTYFTADPHWDHKNVIKFCKRPFKDVQDMNETMIKNWNDLVQPDDTVYVLGDVQFNSDPDKFLSRLTGKKVLIIGNHDYQHNSVLQSDHWESVHDALLVNVQNTMIYLHHYACRVWPRAHKGSLHLYGHSHGRLPGNSQSLDVGVDAWNFTPVTLTEIRKRLKTLKSYKDEGWQDDHHIVY